MVRPLRIEYPGALHHVMARGIDGQAIVGDDEDRVRWVHVLSTCVAACGWRLYAYVLLDNHYHLFLETPRANLSRGMRELNGNYALAYNARRGRRGPLFQDRFKSILVQNDGYWLELSRYIHLNPVRAGLVADPGEWPWGSCSGYFRKRQACSWIQYDTVLDAFGRDDRNGRRRYRRYLMDSLMADLPDPCGSAVQSAILGDEAFVRKIQKQIREKSPSLEVRGLTALQRQHISLEAVLRAVRSVFAVEGDRWESGRRSDDFSRWAAAFLAVELTGERKGRIARALGYRYASSVTRACESIARACKEGHRQLESKLCEVRNLASKH